MENSTENTTLANLDFVVKEWEFFMTKADCDDEVMEIMIAEMEKNQNDTEPSCSSDDSEIEMTRHVKCTTFMVTIDQLNEDDFKSHMRLQRGTVEYLINKMLASVAPSTHNLSGGGFPKTSARKMMYMYIWYMSNTVTYRQLGNLFGVSKSTAWHCVNRVVAWIIEIAHEFIKWPTRTELTATCDKFQRRKKIPGVIGAIDCSHININAPSKNKEGYYDRKQSYSIVLQAVVDADKKFIDVFCGEPGSLHDSRVLRRSALYRRAESNADQYFPNQTFLLADSAYPCKNWLVPTFKDYGNLTQQQQNFNRMHSSARIVVENAFGDLKNRFRRLLKFMEHKNVSAVTNLVSSACVLHNICIIKEGVVESEENDNTEIPQEEMNPVDDGQFRDSRRDQNRRERLLNYLIEKQNV